MSAKACRYCHRVQEAENKFCPNCGAPVSESEPSEENPNIAWLKDQQHILLELAHAETTLFHQIKREATCLIVTPDGIAYRLKDGSWFGRGGIYKPDTQKAQYWDELLLEGHVIQISEGIPIGIKRFDGVGTFYLLPSGGILVEDKLPKIYSELQAMADQYLEKAKAETIASITLEARGTFYKTSTGTWFGPLGDYWLFNMLGRYDPDSTLAQILEKELALKLNPAKEDDSADFHY